MSNKAGLIANVIAILIALGAGYSWVDYKFEKITEERLEPFEHLFVANGLQEVNKEEKAISFYKKALDGLIAQNIDEESLELVVTPFLKAISNSERPHRYEHHVKKLIELSNKYLPMDGDRENSLGWIYLFSNRLEEAEKSFYRSVTLFQYDHLEYMLANTYWGLSLVYLSSGELEKGLNAYYKTWDYDYSSYTVEPTVNDPWVRNKWGKQLSLIYPKLISTYDAFIAYLAEVHEIKSINKQDSIIDEKVLAEKSKSLIGN